MNKAGETLIQVGAEFLLGTVIDYGATMMRDLKDDKLLKDKTPEQLEKDLLTNINKSCETLRRTAFDKAVAINSTKDKKIHDLLIDKARKKIDERSSKWKNQVSSLVVVFEALNEADNDERKTKRVVGEAVDDFIERFTSDFNKIQDWIDTVFEWELVKYESENDIEEAFAYNGVVFQLPKKEAYRTAMFQYYKKAIKMLEENNGHEEEILEMMRANTSQVSISYPKLYKRSLEHHNSDVKKSFVENIEFSEEMFKVFKKKQETNN